MLHVLLESRTRRQRRTGGTALSVATHVAIIALVTAATRRVPPREAGSTKVVAVRIAPPAKTRARSTRAVNRADAAPRIGLLHIEVPRIVPRDLPPVDVGAPRIDDPTRIQIGGSAATLEQLVRGVEDPSAGNSTGSGVWTGAETLMRLTRTIRPRYPDNLRTAGVAGRVVVRFVVDTTGHVDMASTQVLESTHDLFTRAVLDVLPSLRFVPAETNGRRVRSLAEMPFDFVLR